MELVSLLACMDMAAYILDLANARSTVGGGYVFILKL